MSGERARVCYRRIYLQLIFKCIPYFERCFDDGGHGCVGPRRVDISLIMRGSVDCGVVENALRNRTEFFGNLCTSFRY